VKIKDFSVGQIAYLYGYEYYGNRTKPFVAEVEVLRVGRRYVTVKYRGREMRFEDRYEGDPFLRERTDYGVAWMLFLQKETLDEYIERGELERWLQKAAEWTKLRHYTTEQLRAVKRILEEVSENDA
jgi:hypothetical protein